LIDCCYVVVFGKYLHFASIFYIFSLVLLCIFDCIFSVSYYMCVGGLFSTSMKALTSSSACASASACASVAANVAAVFCFFILTDAFGVGGGLTFAGFGANRFAVYIIDRINVSACV
jgi:acid phosphatase family membrane protein YuiD